MLTTKPSALLTVVYSTKACRILWKVAILGTLPVQIERWRGKKVKKGRVKKSLGGRQCWLGGRRAVLEHRAVLKKSGGHMTPLELGEEVKMRVDTDRFVIGE